MSYIVPREKPKCYNCPFRTLDYCGLLIEHDCVTVNVNEMTVSKYCPLAEIPTPHGRLIDADALANTLRDVSKRQKYDKLFSDNVLSVGDVFDAIIADLEGTGTNGYKLIPTVIEAEGSETE